MAWQALFIVWLTTVHLDYYVNEVYVLSDAIEGLIGYTFLVAMVLTSFKFGRSRLSPRQWRLLHKGGIYWLWYYAWSVYWFNLFYYPVEYSTTPVLLDYVYYWGGFLAWGLRLAAWGKKRSSAAGLRDALPRVVGVAALLVGLVASSFASAWSPQVYEFMYAIIVIAFIEPFMPYSPMVPFYPMLIMILGAFLVVKPKG